MIGVLRECGDLSNEGDPLFRLPPKVFPKPSPSFFVHGGRAPRRLPVRPRLLAEGVSKADPSEPSRLNDLADSHARPGRSLRGFCAVSMRRSTQKLLSLHQLGRA